MPLRRILSLIKQHAMKTYWGSAGLAPHILKFGPILIFPCFSLDDRGSRVRFPAAAGNFSFHHRVQNGSGAYPASYLMGIGGSFPGGKAAGAWSWPLTSI